MSPTQSNIWSEKFRYFQLGALHSSLSSARCSTFSLGDHMLSHTLSPHWYEKRRWRLENNASWTWGVMEYLPSYFVEPPMPQFTTGGIPVSRCAMSNYDVGTVQVIFCAIETAQYWMLCCRFEICPNCNTSYPSTVNSKLHEESWSENIVAAVILIIIRTGSLKITLKTTAILCYTGVVRLSKVQHKAFQCGTFCLLFDHTLI